MDRAQKVAAIENGIALRYNGLLRNDEYLVPSFKMALPGEQVDALYLQKPNRHTLAYIVDFRDPRNIEVYLCDFSDSDFKNAGDLRNFAFHTKRPAALDDCRKYGKFGYWYLHELVLCPYAQYSSSASDELKAGLNNWKNHGYQINHLDKDTETFNVQKLEFASPKENIIHGWLTEELSWWILFYSQGLCDLGAVSVNAIQEIHDKAMTYIARKDERGFHDYLLERGVLRRATI